MTKLATIRIDGTTKAVRLDARPDGQSVHVDLGFPDLGAYLAAGSPEAPADAATYPVEGADFAPVVPNPSKVVCVGHNYANHIKEMGRELPEFPVLFPKFAQTLLGANDDVVYPPETEALDWEVEIVVVIGKEIRRAKGDEAADAIAGFTVTNDISVRDWQFRTIEWTQGKIWEATTPVGPYVVTPDEVGGVRPALQVQTIVNGEVMQDDNTGTLVFDPVFLVEYISTMITLKPGDLILGGTPAGVGQARDPKVFLKVGDKVVTSIEGLGECVNTIVAS